MLTQEISKVLGTLRLLSLEGGIYFLKQVFKICTILILYIGPNI